MKPKPALGILFWLALGGVGFVHLSCWIIAVTLLPHVCSDPLGFPIWQYLYGLGFSEFVLLLAVFWGRDKDKKTMEAPPEHRKTVVWNIRKWCWGYLLFVFLAGPGIPMFLLGRIIHGHTVSNQRATSQPAPSVPAPKNRSVFST